MDLFEKFNRSFGSWYEGLFGGTDDVRPKDILRRILAALEDNRKEGFDNRVYVPNQYVLEIAVDDEEEKEYLLSFLDRDELESAIRRYCQQNHYHIRGALDFTIREVDDPDLKSRRGEKVRVRCRYNTKITGPEPAGRVGSGEAIPAPDARSSVQTTPFEERTVASIYDYQEGEEGGTVPSVAAAALIVYAPDRPPFRYTIARGSLTIGRSPKAGNDLVIESDGQISKRHARLELDPDGRFTLYDTGSTNGTKVNGRRVDNRTLNDGDEITLGATRLTFQQTSREEAAYEDLNGDNAGDAAKEPSLRPTSRPARGAYGGAAATQQRNGNDANLRSPADSSVGSVGSLPSTPRRSLRAQTARLVLLNGDQAVDDFLLASETVIGRGVTNDIVLPDRSIATRHARIVNNGDGYALEAVAERPAVTLLNGQPLTPGYPEPLKDTDRIVLGEIVFRFESGG